MGALRGGATGETPAEPVEVEELSAWFPAGELDAGDVVEPGRRRAFVARLRLPPH